MFIVINLNALVVFIIINLKAFGAALVFFLQAVCQLMSL